MKRLIMLWCICLQAFVSSAAASWTSLDFYRSIVEPAPQCFTLVASNEDSQEANQNNEAEEEEEPDCD